MPFHRVVGTAARPTALALALDIAHGSRAVSNQAANAGQRPHGTREAESDGGVSRAPCVPEGRLLEMDCPCRGTAGEAAAARADARRAREGRLVQGRAVDASGACRAGNQASARAAEQAY